MTPAPSADPSSPRHDLLVVGGGPAGSATAYWAALAGLDVVVVEKKSFPREKTCGDGLTPRAVHQLDAMGLGEQLHRYHRYEGLRAVAHHRSLELHWPEHPVFPSHGYVVRRSELDSFVAAHAEAAGADVRHGVEAVAPLLEDGLVVGARVKEVATGEHHELRARYVVVADGANSRFGRALGTRRNKAMPQGLAIRTYYESPLHDEPWIESALDLRDRSGASLPGYGWIFPVGDGTINVGVGPAVHLPGLAIDQHLPPDGRVRRHDARLLGDRPGAPGPGTDRGSPPDGRLHPPEGRPHLGGGGRRRAAASTRSTARASTTRTRPADSPPPWWQSA